MGQKLRHLWGRVEIRVLMLLVCGIFLAGLAICVAQLARSSSELDLPIVSSWDDLVGEYLRFREANYALVVPDEFTSYGQTEAMLKEYAFDALQAEPGWYWNFDGGVFYFDEASPLAKQVEHGTEIVIYEDMAKEEILVLRVPKKEGGDYQEEIVYRAPSWPEVQEGEDYAIYLWRELSKRRIAWQVTLKSSELAEKEVDSGLSTESASSGSGMMLLFEEEWTNHLWMFIYGPADWLTNVVVKVHVPEGFTNQIEIFSITNLLEFPWSLVATNLATEGTNDIYWTDPAQENLEVCFYTAGNADVDSDGDGLPDAREKFLYGTDPLMWDTDCDGVGDSDEIAGGTNPNDPNEPPNVLGTIYYNGQQTNLIRVLAVTDSNSWSLTYSTTINEPGGYQMSSLPASNYWLKAFRDLDGDGVLDEIEARGEYAINPVEITGQVAGIDITLTDPDSDGDGLSDYEELYLTGTDPEDPNDGAEMLQTAREQIVAHWNVIYDSPLVFTNEPGSAADLQDLRAALLGLSGQFHEATSETP
ncbi:MAG: thrombospondin type 3 repeat-containing protein [Verrucomicrobia bacterium]|nr:thrombospondin type 3 repeat-containing protein [Verrucomicrobiota bacterium]